MTLMKKVKFISVPIGIALMAMFTFGALFAPDGMNLAPTHPWMPQVAESIGNFVTALNTTIVVFTVFVILMMFSDNYPGKQVEGALASFDLLEYAEMLRFKPLSFTLLTIPYWLILIASGWVTTFFVWALLMIVMRIDSSVKLAHLKATYLNNLTGDGNEKASANTGKLTDNPLG